MLKEPLAWPTCSLKQEGSPEGRWPFGPDLVRGCAPPRRTFCLPPPSSPRHGLSGFSLAVPSQPQLPSQSLSRALRCRPVHAGLGRDASRQSRARGGALPRIQRWSNCPSSTYQFLLERAAIVAGTPLNSVWNGRFCLLVQRAPARAHKTLFLKLAAGRCFTTVNRMPRPAELPL